MTPALRKPIGSEILIDYTNHRGERGWRRIIPLTIAWVETEWHPGQQWLLHAFDCDKRSERTFAMRDIHAWQFPQPSPETETP